MSGPYAEILRALQLLTPPGGVFEVRALGDRAASGYFDADHLEQAAKAIEALDSAGTYEGIYFTLNTINPALLSRRANRIETRMPKNAATTSDDDVIRRRWFVVDIDAERASGISSTDEEHCATLDVAGKIAQFLTEFYEFPAPILADSGNGAHLLYRIDLPNDEQSKILIERCLKALGAAFDTPAKDGAPGWEVDPTMANAARICKLYGTVARKGDHTSSRPHRRAKILEVPDAIEVAPVEALKALAARVPEEEPLHRNRPRSGEYGPGIDLEDWLQEYGASLPSYHAKNRSQYTTFYEFEVCPWDPSHRDRSAWVGQLTSGALDAGCHHKGCRGYKWRDLRALAEPKQARQKQETPAPGGPAEPKRGESADAEEPPTPPDEATVSEALRVLEEEDPIEYLLEVFHTDHAGDDVVALCCYVAAASSVVANSKGLHVLTIGPSGKGKSASYETAGKQLPGGIVIGGGMSDKALLYHEYDEGSIIVVDDRAMSAALQELFRNATSDIRLKSAWRTVGQNREAITLSIPPRCIWWMASAEDRTDDQFHNRCLQPWVDDSVEADQRFADHFLAQVASGDDGDLDPRFDVCKVMWSFILDEPKPVWVWFAEAIEFQDITNRRNVRIFIDLIMSFARIRYRQRQVDDRGRLIATLGDFKSAVDLYSALVTDRGSQALQLTSEMNGLLTVIRDRGFDQFTINDLVYHTRAPYQTIRRILKGRPERDQAGLLDRCPVIRTKFITVSMETNEGTRRGYREEQFTVDLAGLEAWMGGRLITIDEDKLEKVISRFSRSFPSLSPLLGKHMASKNLRLNPDLTDNNNIINNNYNVYSPKEESQSVCVSPSPSPVCSTLRFENGKRHENALSELEGYPPVGETERESGPVKSLPKLNKAGIRGETQHPGGERQGDNGDLATWFEKLRLPRNFSVTGHRHNPDRPQGLCSVGLCNRQPTWESETGSWPICEHHYQLIKQREVGP